MLRVESSISGVLNPSMSIQVRSSLGTVDSFARIISESRIVERPQDLTQAEISISLNNSVIFNGFVDDYQMVSDGDAGIHFEVPMRSICAPTIDSLVCSEIATATQDDVLFVNSPLSAIVDNTMRWEEISHPFIFRGDSGNAIVDIFQWQFGENFGSTILRLATERGLIFTDTPNGSLQFIDFKSLENEALHTIKENECKRMALKIDYTQRYQRYIGIARQGTVVRESTKSTPSVVVVLPDGTRAVTHRRETTVRTEEQLPDVQEQRFETTPNRKNWCRDYTGREMSADELKRAVNYEVERRRSAGTVMVVTIADLVRFAKGERVEFEFSTDAFEGVQTDGWTINSVIWRSSSGRQGNTTTIECVPTQQFSTSPIDGAYDHAIGEGL